VRLLIVADAAGFRRLARAALTAAGFTVVGEAADAAGARAAAAASAPELVLVDVHLGADDGRALGAELLAGRPAPAVVLVSSDPAAGRGPLPFVAKEDLLSADLHALARPAAAATH
jgi:DNA-binding NarL/FixJ family response regulator